MTQAPRQSSGQAPGQALQGIRVLDLSERMSGAYAARLFADYGAEVIMVEPEGGHPLRQQPPFLDDQPGMERSLLHAYVNWNKQSVSGVDLRQLITTADVVITTGRFADDDEMSAIFAELPKTSVHLSITPHGLDGPLADENGNHLTHCARSGWSNINRFQDDGPLQLPLRQTGYTAGVAAYVAGLGALYRLQATGHGECVDVSELEAMCSTSAPWAIVGLFSGSERMQFGPAGGRFRGTPGPLWDTANGGLNMGFGDWGKWREAMTYLGLDEIATDQRYEPVLGRYQQDLRPVALALAEGVASRDKWEVYHELARLHCISGVVQNTQELVNSEQFAARGFLVETVVEGKKLKAPGAAVKLYDTPAVVRNAAPRLGQDTVKRRAAAQRVRADKCLQPLAGVRVLTFTQAWSGTFGTELLAFLGADVVQIEARKRPDVWRGAGAPVPRAIVNEDLEQSPLNTNGMFNSVNLCKRAITLDMASERGREMFWQMVPGFDVIAENFSPHVMSKWGITLETLQEKRPDIIFASLSGYGRQGPLSEYPANGSTTEPMSGLASIHGYENDQPMNTGGLFPDPVTGYYFAAAILTALVSRQSSGKGQRIDESMMEGVAVQVGDAILDYEANGTVQRPQGNRHPRMAPHNYYQTADDGWVAIAAENDDQWRDLARVLSIADERFAGLSGRKQFEVELDEMITEWTRVRTVDDACRQLSGANACVAPVANFLDVYRLPGEQHRHRGYLAEVTHPECGTHHMPTMPWVMTHTEAPVISHAPRFGEHSREVFEQELGITADEYEHLESQGVTGTTRL
jgi:crotonobetainyl-CoA:carnitine CoA-transferase CaiB-like acyl-CoA transferase